MGLAISSPPDVEHFQGGLALRSEMLREVTIGVQLAGIPPHREELFEVTTQTVSFVIDWFQVVKKQPKAFQQLIPRQVRQAGPSNSHPVSHKDWGSGHCTQSQRSQVCRGQT